MLYLLVLALASATNSATVLIGSLASMTRIIGGPSTIQPIIAKSEDSTRKPSTVEGSREGKPPATAQTNVNVNLTSEQRTKIHSVVVNEKSAPRVANVNFKLSIGTVVPRSVRVVPVPASIVEIQPAWRGFMYFLVGDQVVIVEPGTLRIVAVISA